MLGAAAWKRVTFLNREPAIPIKRSDITILPGAIRSSFQPGATITDYLSNSAFYVNGIIRSVGTEANPITFTAPISQYPRTMGWIPGRQRAQGCHLSMDMKIWLGPGADCIPPGSTRETISVQCPSRWMWKTAG